MINVLRALALLLLAGLPAVLTASTAWAAFNCACLDGNGDDACGDAADTPILDDDWLKGPLSGLGGAFPGTTFVLPSGCNVITGLAPKGGIVVNARRIVIRGQLISTPTGGEGVQFNAAEEVVMAAVDVQAPKPRLESGGINKLAVNVSNAAVAKSSVALRSGGTCLLNRAELQGNPITGSGQVGIQCNGDLTLHATTIIAAGVDIQSLSGAIIGTASPGAAPGPPPPIGIECDDPTKNATAGNNNGQLDAGDFPCQLDFGSVDAVAAICSPTPGGAPPSPPNDIRALNNPLVMIARANLKLDSAATPGNLIEGRLSINLVSEDGTVDTDNATVTNHTSNSPAGGAKIWVFADPTTVNRSTVLKEKSTGPSLGNIEVNGACFVSVGPVRIGGTLVGTPAAPPCAQSPAGFMPVASGP